MYTIIVPKNPTIVYTSGAILIFPKSAKFSKHAISYKNKIVPEIIYLINVYICICILYPMPKLLIYMYRCIKRIYMEF